jgi:hypothetical protein
MGHVISDIQHPWTVDQTSLSVHDMKDHLKSVLWVFVLPDHEGMTRSHPATADADIPLMPPQLQVIATRKW